MPNDAPNDAKTELDRNTHLLQDQPTTAEPAGTAKRDDPELEAQRQPPQAQQRDTTGTTLPDPEEPANDDEEVTGGA